MLVLNSNGDEVKWNYAKFYSRKERSGKSKHHIKARSLLASMFPYNTLYEEVSLPTDPVMYADFFIPDLCFIVEIHGEQHYDFNPFFHKSKMDFYKAKARDKQKKQWCELNEFKFIELSYKEEKEWQNQILAVFQ